MPIAASARSRREQEGAQRRGSDRRAGEGERRRQEQESGEVLRSVHEEQSENHTSLLKSAARCEDGEVRGPSSELQDAV